MKKTKGRAVIRKTKPTLVEACGCEKCQLYSTMIETSGVLLAGVAESGYRNKGRGCVRANVCGKCKNHIVEKSVMYQSIDDEAWSSDMIEELNAYDAERVFLVAFFDDESNESFRLRGVTRPVVIQAADKPI